MEEMTIATFKISHQKNSLNVIWIMCGIFLLTAWTPAHASVFPLIWKSLGGLFIALGTFIVIMNLLTPYLIISKQGITIKPGPFYPSEEFYFRQIDSISFINPDHSITLQLQDGNTKNIPIHQLSKKDRIRCIFLVESDINRKYI